MPDPDELGAELADLFRAGRTTLPTLASQYGSARKDVDAVEAADPMRRTPGLGVGPTGPSIELGTAIAAVTRRLASLEEVLRDVGVNLVKTARDYAETDAETEAAFRRHGGEL